MSAVERRVTQLWPEWVQAGAREEIAAAIEILPPDLRELLRAVAQQRPNEWVPYVDVGPLIGLRPRAFQYAMAELVRNFPQYKYLRPFRIGVQNRRFHVRLDPQHAAELLGEPSGDRSRRLKVSA